MQSPEAADCNLHYTAAMSLRTLITAVCLVSIAQNACADEPRERRAKPPTWTDDQRSVFFDDIQSQLVGPRPDFGAMAKSIASTAGASTADDQALVGRRRWAEFISADTIENEIKRQTQTIARVTQTATGFKGGGYREARDSFSILALMFRLAAEHEEDARWRSVAPGMSSLLARAAANGKVGTDGSYREAVARAQDLADLVRGGRPDTPPAAPDQLWSDLADRGPVMKRMETAQQERLGPLLGGKANFVRNAENAAHEAQVLAVLAELLTREEFVDAGDEEYDGFARACRDAAAAISRAAEQEDYQSAREAMGRVSQSCSDCHDLYRG